MKFVICALVFVFLGGAYAPPPGFDFNDPVFVKNRDECAKEHNIDITIFEKLKKGEKPDKSVFETQDMKCFSKCLSEKSGLINANGEPQMDKIKEKFHLEDGNPILEDIKACSAASTSTDPCEKQHEQFMCMKKKIMEKKSS